jgi:hypothetical protein
MVFSSLLRAKKANHGISGKAASLDWRFYFTIEGDAYVLHEIR